MVKIKSCIFVNFPGSETKGGNDIVVTQREQELIPINKSETPGQAVENDMDAIISFDSNESVDNIIVKKENDRLISELLFNDQSSDNITESSSEKNIFEMDTESNHDEESSKNFQLSYKNSQCELKQELHDDSIADSTSANDSYLQNFMLIITTVLSQNEDKQLFNDSDNAIFKSFQELSNSSKTLYVRLFQRKRKWFRTRNIRYPRISENLEPCFAELIKLGKLIRCRLAIHSLQMYIISLFANGKSPMKLHLEVSGN